MRKICLIYNFAQHYRKNIFVLLDQNLPIDFVFGDKYLDVKKMDYSKLENFKKEVRNRTLIKYPFTYQQGVLSLITKRYDIYLMLGDIHCISTWLMLIVAKIFRKKIFLWSHGWYGRETYSKKILKLCYFHLAKGVFLYGNYAKNLMIKEGISIDKLHVIYNSLDYDQHILLRHKLKKTMIYVNHFNNNYPNLIFIGRITTEKRLDLLIEALSLLRSNNEFYNLTIIGSGPVEKDLRNLAEMIELQQSIWFYGACYDESLLSELIFNADLCISPGNVGLTAIHSMSFGTPVLTHNSFPNQGPEFEAIEEGKTGSFFEYNNKYSLSEKVSEWMTSNYQSEDVRRYCYETVDSKYNPHEQVKIFKKYLV